MASRWTLPGSQIGKDGIREKESRYMLYYSEVVGKMDATCKLGLIPVSWNLLYFLVSKQRNLMQFISE